MSLIITVICATTHLWWYFILTHFAGMDKTSLDTSSGNLFVSVSQDAHVTSNVPLFGVTQSNVDLCNYVPLFGVARSNVDLRYYVISRQIVIYILWWKGQ